MDRQLGQDTCHFKGCDKVYSEQSDYKERMKDGPILCFETSGKSASAAIIWPDGRCVAQDTDPTAGSARTLAATTSQLLGAQSLIPRDLVAVRGNRGPWFIHGFASRGRHGQSHGLCARHPGHRG